MYGALREPRLTDRKTEPSSPSCPPAPERTNTNRSLNMQTEKDVKEPNSAPTRGIQCTQSACRETRPKIALMPNFPFLALVPTSNCQKTRLGEYI